MLFEIIIVVCAAFAMSGVTLILSRLLRVRLPKAVIPIVAAVSIVAATAWLRHSWADRAASSLPEGLSVIATVPYSSVLEPWTLVRPRAGGLMVLDGRETMRHPDHPDLALVSILLLEPNAETIKSRHIVDCAKRRRAPVTADTTFTQDGLPKPEVWVSDEEPKALYGEVCKTPRG
ncbi:hypothetical protein [Azospirillum aestuarii]|uniref:hypothetical protein n=1 Tax=Azospirillum aestuarii TaxID=2802052 RepID=UPI004054EC80